MKLPFINSGNKIPKRPDTTKIKNVKPFHRVRKNVAEIKHGIVLYLHFDGIQIVDLLRYLRENSLTEHFRSVDPAIQNPEKELSFNRTDKTQGIRLDDKTYLTWREFEIMERLLKGWLNKEIANDLGLRDNTIRNNLQRIFRKFIVGNRSEAILHYLKIRDKLKVISIDH